MKNHSSQNLSTGDMQALLGGLGLGGSKEKKGKESDIHQSSRWSALLGATKRSGARKSSLKNSDSLSPINLIKRLSNNIGDFINKTEYKRYTREVSEFFTKCKAESEEHDSKAASLFRTIFMNELELSMTLDKEYSQTNELSNTIISIDGKYLVVWSCTSVCVVNIPKLQVVFKTPNENSQIRGCFTDPDSMLLVVARSDGVKLHTLEDGKIRWDSNQKSISKGKDEFNPFASQVSEDPKQTEDEILNLYIEKIKFSFFETKEQKPSIRQSNEEDFFTETSSSNSCYKLLFGDKNNVYTVDITMKDDGFIEPVFSVSFDRLKMKQTYYQIISSDYLYNYLESGTKFLVGVKECKGQTVISRWKLNMNLKGVAANFQSNALKTQGGFSQRQIIIFEQELENSLSDNAFTFQYAQTSPFRTDSTSVAVFHTTTQTLYRCALNSFFGFKEVGENSAFTALELGLNRSPYKSVLTCSKHKHLVCIHEDYELNIWQKENEWYQQYIDRSSTEYFNAFISHDDQFLIVRSASGFKIIPIGLDSPVNIEKYWIADNICVPSQQIGLKIINKNYVVSFAEGSVYLMSSKGKNKFRKIFQAPYGILECQVLEVKPVKGTNDIWIVTREKTEGHLEANLKAYLYNIIKMELLDPFFKDPRKSVIISDYKFSNDGLFSFMQESIEGTPVKSFIWSYAQRKIVKEFDEAGCFAAHNGVLFGFFSSKVKQITAYDLEDFKEVAQMNHDESVFDFKVEMKLFPEPELLLVFGARLLQVISLKEKKLVGVYDNGGTDLTKVYKANFLEVTKDKKSLIVGYPQHGSVTILDLTNELNIIHDSKLHPFDHICCSPDSKYLLLAKDDERKASIICLEKLSIKATMNINYRGQDHDSSLKNFTFSDDGSNLVCFHQRLDSVVKVSLPFGDATASNLLYKIYPIILRLFSTDSEQHKEMLAREILKAIEKAGTHVVELLPLLTVIIYMLDLPIFFKEYAGRFVGVDHLCLHHNIWNLLLKTFKVDSFKGFTDLFSDYLERYQKCPHIDEVAVRHFLFHNNRYLGNSLYRFLLRKILFWKRREEFTGELVTKKKQVAYLIENQENILQDPFTLTHMTMTESQIMGGNPGGETTASNKDSNSGETDEVLKKEQVKKAVKSLLKDKPSNLTNFQVTESLISLDFGNGSEFSAVFFDIINSLPEDELKDYYSVFVHFKWRKIYKFALIYSLVYWLLNLLAFLFNGFYYNNITMGMAVIILNILFLLFEIKCGMADIRRYFSSPWNWMDLGIHGFSILTTLILMPAKDVDYTNSLGWFRSLNVLFLSTRGITMLRIFNPTRYLITILLRTFNDVVPFITVLTFLILIFSYVWRIVNDFERERDSEPTSFYDSLKFMIDVFFNQYDSEGMSEYQFSLLTISNIVLALTMANFLIALISSTFERISRERELHDVKDVISMISDFDAFLKGLIKRKKQRFKKYIVLFPEYSNTEEYRKMAKLITDQKESLLARLQETESRFSLLEQKLKAMDERAEERGVCLLGRLEGKLDGALARIEEICPKEQLATSIVMPDVQ